MGYDEYPDKSQPVQLKAELRYNRNLADEIYVACADGGRVTFPCPDLKNGEYYITEFEYKIGKILSYRVNDKRGYSKNKLNQANIQVK